MSSRKGSSGRATPCADEPPAPRLAPVRWGDGLPPAEPSRSLGILSWKGYDSLRPMLRRLIEKGVHELFDERLIFFPEIDDEARAIAREHGFDCSGSPQNLGIFGGFRALGEALSGDTILLLENDLRIIEPEEEAERQLRAAFDLIEGDAAKVVFLRHTGEPGEDFATLDKYRRFFPPADATLGARVQGFALRLFRSDKRARLIGTAPYASATPEKLFPREIERDPESGFWLMRPRNKAWTNQSFVVRRAFFLDTLMDYVERAETNRRVNGFKNIEIELNSAWWRNQPWKIAIAPGLFTHQREGDRGY
ncbi:MAG: hypothetical protein AAFZ01_00070 [Pseudomonadota bacterium]